MQARRVAARLIVLIVCGSLFAYQKPFRQYPGVEYDDFPLPKDWNEKTEFVFTRLMYPPAPVSEAVRRLTRIHIRSVEQPVNLDDGDDVYSFPFIYAVAAGARKTDRRAGGQAARLPFARRVFMTDDYWGPQDQAVFEEWMHRCFRTGRW